MPLSDSPAMQMIRAMATALQADDEIIAQFGPFDADRRIRFDDGGDLDPADSPVLILTAFEEQDDYDSFGDLGTGTCRRGVGIAQVICVAVPDLSDGEDEKVLLVNLTGVVKRAVMRQLDNAAWLDIRYRRPSTIYDQADSYRRSVSVVDVWNRFPSSD